MNKKLLGILISFLVIGYGIYFFITNPGYFFPEQATQNEELTVRLVVRGFGNSLKNVSLLSTTVNQEIEDNYTEYLSPILLSQWKEDPSRALGRKTSSPWPERIEVLEIKQFGSGAYDVSGNIVEVTSSDLETNSFSGKQAIDLSVVNYDGKWLISGMVLGEYVSNDLKRQIAECMPKSDSLSRERCLNLIRSVDSFDRCVLAGFPIMESYPRKCSTPLGAVFTEVIENSWASALQLIDGCVVDQIDQAHNLEVTLHLKDGSSLVVFEPQIDDIFRAVEAAEEKCGKILMSTE